MKIINLTSHPITIEFLFEVAHWDLLGEEKYQTVRDTFEPSGIVARCEAKTLRVGQIGPFPLTQTYFGKVENLPPVKDGVYYLVSRVVAEACPRRHDLLFPNEIQRDGGEPYCLSFGVAWDL